MQIRSRDVFSDLQMVTNLPFFLKKVYCCALPFNNITCH